MTKRNVYELRTISGDVLDTVEGWDTARVEAAHLLGNGCYAVAIKRNGKPVMYVVDYSERGFPTYVKHARNI